MELVADVGQRVLHLQEVPILMVRFRLHEDLVPQD